MISFKQRVYRHYQEILNDKVKMLQDKLQDLINTTNNETKSSAGDKHETARAMMQIEQDNIRKQLKDALEQKFVFEKINPASSLNIITNGSLITTNKGNFFLTVALGKATVDNTPIIALSPLSPLGTKLFGLKINEVAVLNGTQYLIENLE